MTAIFSEDDVPVERKQFVAANAEFFSEGVSRLGSPAGAAQVGAQPVDHADGRLVGSDLTSIDVGSPNGGHDV